MGHRILLVSLLSLLNLFVISEGGGEKGKGVLPVSVHHSPLTLPPQRQAGEGSRTLVSSLEGYRSTVELHPHVSK